MDVTDSGKCFKMSKGRFDTRRNVGVIGIASSFPELLQIVCSVDHSLPTAGVATLICVAGG